MSRFPRPCTVCGQPSTGGHCVDAKAVRNADAKACAAQVARSPRCSCCGTTNDLTADHVRPVSRGGRAVHGLRTLCRSCNASAGAGGRCQLDHH